MDGRSSRFILDTKRTKKKKLRLKNLDACKDSRITVFRNGQKSLIIIEAKWRFYSKLTTENQQYKWDFFWWFFHLFTRISQEVTVFCSLAIMLFRIISYILLPLPPLQKGAKKAHMSGMWGSNPASIQGLGFLIRKRNKRRREDGVLIGLPKNGCCLLFQGPLVCSCKNSS